MSSSNLLFKTPNEHQIDLVKLIGRPWMADDLADTKGWPVWDFVRRRYAANHRDEGATIDAAEGVLSSLPSITSSSYRTGSYGLYWTAGRGLPGLQASDRIGLTVAGLHHLWESADEPTRNSRPNLGLICVNLVSTAANREIELSEDNDWTKVAKANLDVRSSLTKMIDTPVEILGQVLQHDFTILARSTSQFNYAIDYGGGRLERFAGVNTTMGYINVLKTMTDAAADIELAPSPLRFPGALDYLALVLDRHAEWEHPGPFINIFHFDAATRLLDPPASQAQFAGRCSDLWNIIGHLGVPTASNDAYERRSWNPEQKGTINNFQVWLEGQLGEDYNLACASALRTIRRIGHIRQASQHASGTTRQRADLAFTSLNVNVPVTNWQQAWLAVLDACAAAFYAIASALRTQGPGPHP